MTDQPEVPVSEALLVPLLEEAGDALRSLDVADVPLSLRHLHGFDRRGLTHGPAPRKLRKALDSEDRFREQVVDRFLARDEVRSALAAWAPERAVEAAEVAAARGDLPLLASALWAARPDGYAFGLGAASAAETRLRRDWGDQADARALNLRLEESEEGRRRAEATRVAAEAEVERVEAELREERRSRRAREDTARAAADEQRRRAETLEGDLARAQAAAEAADARSAREAGRCRTLEEEVKALRSDLAAAREQAAAAEADRGSFPDDDARAPDARAFEIPREIPRAAPRAERPLDRRVLAPLPPGMVADSVDGAVAMLKAPGVVLVVDGYNVTQRSWGDATPSEQRTRLAMALAQMHLRGGCETTVVFDGDGTEGVPPFRRPGLRVLFSARGEEADEVVVREVDRLPKRVPVVVASSDAWVREHAEAAGARVVSADTLLAALRA